MLAHSAAVPKEMNFHSHFMASVPDTTCWASTRTQRYDTCLTRLCRPTTCHGVQVNAEAIKIGKEADEANAIAAECQAGLDKALPALQSAEEALNVLTKKDMSELKVSLRPALLSLEQAVLQAVSECQCT